MSNVTLQASKDASETCETLVGIPNQSSSGLMKLS